MCAFEENVDVAFELYVKKNHDVYSEISFLSFSCSLLTVLFRLGFSFGILEFRFVERNWCV